LLVVSAAGRLQGHIYEESRYSISNYGKITDQFLAGFYRFEQPLTRFDVASADFFENSSPLRRTVW
jgi:hypothetical protein